MVGTTPDDDVSKASDVRRCQNDDAANDDNDDDDDNKPSFVWRSLHESRAEPHTGVGLTGMGAKGKLDVAGAREPGLGIDSPTMPGIGENHTHRSQGSLREIVPSRTSVEQCC